MLTKIGLIFIALAVTMPGEERWCRTVDIVEFNTLWAIGPNGEPVQRLHQVILWRYGEPEHHVAQWMAINDHWIEGDRAYWLTGRGAGQRLFCCRFRQTLVTNTGYDPERKNLEFLEETRRIRYFAEN